MIQRLYNSLSLREIKSKTSYPSKHPFWKTTEENEKTTLYRTENCKLKPNFLFSKNDHFFVKSILYKL